MTCSVRLFQTILELVSPKELGVTYPRVSSITTLPRGLGGFDQIGADLTGR